MSEHVTDSDIASFRAGTLDRARVLAVGKHVRECASCEARVWGSREVRDAVNAVSSNAAEPPRARMRWVAAAAAVILIAIAVVVWSTARATRRDVPPRSPVIVKQQQPSPEPAPKTHPWDALVAESLRSGSIDRPAWLRRADDEVVRGPEDRIPLRLLAPSGVAVESQTPELRWTPATACEVTIARNGDAVARSGRIIAARWTPAVPLARGVWYDWQVGVAGGEHVTSRFLVLAEDDARLLASVRATGDALATGIMAARLGAIDEALAQFDRSSDPRARALAEKIRRW